MSVKCNYVSRWLHATWSPAGTTALTHSSFLWSGQNAVTWDTRRDRVYKASTQTQLMKESGHDTCFLLDRDTEKHKHDLGSVLTNASARMTLIVSKSSLSIRNKLQLRCCRVWMAILPSCDWLLTVNTDLWLVDWPVTCSCIRPVPGIPGLTMGQSKGQGVSVKVVYSAASIIDNNIRRIMQCQIRERRLSPDQSPPWVTRPGQWEPVCPLSLQLHLTPFMNYDGQM